MWDSSHTHTHHTINQIGTSQSPSLKSLTSSLGPILWTSISEPTLGYRAGSNTICNDSKKSASHICVIPQKDQSQLRLLIVVNKAQIYLVNTQCETHHTSHNQSNWGITIKAFLEIDFKLHHGGGLTGCNHNDHDKYGSNDY